MQMTSDRNPFEPWLEVLAIALNIALGTCLWVARSIFSYSHLMKTNLAVFAEWGFVLGAIAIVALLILRQKITPFSNRFGFLVVITMFNQICVTALLVSVLPFGGKVVPPP